MVREIGSEFHRVAFGTGHGFVYPISGHIVFSGRTAIETVLKEIPEAKKAMLPSYCCDSMIEPFRRAGIEVGFYPVNYENGMKIDVETSDDIDIVVWCNYFGFSVPMPDLSSFVNRGGVIVEDITHRLFSTPSYSSQSHYLVASLRKWEPINCGGYCAAVKGRLHHLPDVLPPQEFIETKTVSMELKTMYMSDLEEEKKIKFLSMFAKSNKWISENFSGLTIDAWSQEYLANVDMEGQKRIRRRNAKVLYKGLKNVQFLFPEKDMDCPLFVPILLPNRDEVRGVLTANKIYCPVHWPHPNADFISNLYEQELSLICDQRYNEEDMERLVSVLQSLL